MGHSEAPGSGVDRYRSGPLTATISLPLESNDDETLEEPSGLTPASGLPSGAQAAFHLGLKHLKRQRDALNEDKQRLQSELNDAWQQ